MTQRMLGHFRNRQTALGEAVFQKMLNSGIEIDEHAWTVVLDGWSANQRLDKVRETIELMRTRGHPVHLQAWGVLMKSLIAIGRLQEAVEIIEKLEREGPRPDVITYNMVLTNMSRHGGQSKLAEAIFRKIAEVGQPDNISFRGYLHVLAEDGNFDAIPRVLREMRESNVPMGLPTFTPLIKAAFRHRRTDLVDFYLTELETSGVDLPLAAVLVSGYWKARDLKRLFPLIERLRKELRLDVPLYTNIAQIYESTNQHELVLQLPKEMDAKQLRPEQTNVELGGIVLDSALKVRTPEQCYALVEELWRLGFPLPEPSLKLLEHKLRTAGHAEKADALAKEAEHRQYERLARKIRREVLHASEGRPLYLPKVPTKRVYWSNTEAPPASGTASEPQRGGGARRGERR